MTTGNDTMLPCTPGMVGLDLLMMDHILKGRPDGKQLSGAEAVRIATINSARSLGSDDEFGSIESGKFADMIVLDRDLFEIETADIGDTLVLRSIFGGEIVYSRSILGNEDTEQIQNGGGHYLSHLLRAILTENQR